MAEDNQLRSMTCFVENICEIVPACMCAKFIVTWTDCSVLLVIAAFEETLLIFPPQSVQLSSVTVVVSFCYVSVNRDKIPSLCSEQRRKPTRRRSLMTARAFHTLDGAAFDGTQCATPPTFGDGAASRRTAQPSTRLTA